jgi:ligand-binding sensor domain-containing protein/signal transduction histidine kinase
MLRRILLLIFLQTGVGYLYADTLHSVFVHRHFSEDDGLTTKTVYSVLQDRQGFIWLATDAGAFRYDGKAFRRFTVDDGISDNEILQLYEDRLGRIWFLTFNGYLSYWQEGKIYNPVNCSFLKRAFMGSSIINAYEDRTGSIWFTSMKMGAIRLKDTTVEMFRRPAEERDRLIMQFHEDSLGNLYYFFQNLMINIFKRDSIRIPNGIQVGLVNKNNGDYIFTTGDGLYRIHGMKITKEIKKEELPYILKIINLNDDNGKIWVCALGEGCTLYENGIRKKNFLNGTSVTTVIRDKEGNYWCSTMNDGVYLFYNNENNVSNYDKNSGLSENEISSVLMDKNKSLWLGYNNGIIDKVNNQSITRFNLREKNDPTYFRMIGLKEQHDTIWAGSDIGVFYLADKKIKKIPYTSGLDQTIKYSVKQLISDDKDNLYATFSLNFLKLKRQNTGWYMDPVFNELNRTFSAIYTDSGKFIVSGIAGLMQYIPGQSVQRYNTDYDFSYQRIIDMKIDNDKNLLLASSSEGVFVLNGRNLVQHISRKDSLSDNSCHRILLRDSLLYIATANGLNIFKKENRLWKFSKVITTRDGILSNSINDVTFNGNLLYLATDKGLSVFNMDSFNMTEYHPKVIITEIIADSIYYFSHNDFSFNSDVPRILIKFSYPVFDPLNKVKLKYRLIKSNSNEPWIISDNNEVEFSSLSPGEYKFEVKPNINTSKNEITSLKMVILPMWWQTFIFKFILVLISLLILTYYVRIKLKTKYELRLEEFKRKSMIEEERNRIANDMHDDIGADLTQISIWTNILRTNNFQSNGIIEKISSLSKDVLLKMDQIIWALNSIHNHSRELISYINSYSSEYLEGVKIDFEFIIDENLPDLSMSMYERRNIFLVIKELLHNTVKHSQARNVKIHIFMKHNFMVVDYTDDGCGFDANNKGNGLGLLTMKKRMMEINSSIQMEKGDVTGMRAILYIGINNKLVVT